MGVPKPKEGAPCNGCGVCCAVEACAIARMAGRNEAPCFFLVRRGAAFSCKLVETELEHGLPPLIASALGVGRGCDSESTEGEVFHA